MSPTLGWDALAAIVETRLVPREHSLLLAERRLRHVIEHLRAWIRENRERGADEGSGSSDESGGVA